jgi:hypothetical protein
MELWNKRPSPWFDMSAALGVSWAVASDAYSADPNAQFSLATDWTAGSATIDLAHQREPDGSRRVGTDLFSIFPIKETSS